MFIIRNYELTTMCRYMLHSMQTQRNIYNFAHLMYCLTPSCGEFN